MAAGGIPEAVAALSLGISFAAIVVNTLTGTISNTERTYYWYKRCRPHLQTMRDRLQKCKDDLTDWENLWGYDTHSTQSRYPRDNYDHFWSHEGLQGVDDRIIRIRNSGENLRQTLSGRNRHSNRHSVKSLGLRGFIPLIKFKVSDKEWQTWRNRLTNNISEGDITNIDEKIRTKIAFTLWRKNSLTEDIARMADDINALISETTRRFRINQGHEQLDLRPTKDEIEYGHKLYQFCSRLAKFLEPLHERYSRSGSNWHLQLEYTDNVACKHIRSMVEFEANLLRTIPQGSNAKTEGFRMRFVFDPDSVNPEEPTPTTAFRGSFTANYLSWFRETDFDDDDRWNASKADRATAILGFVNWTILLWQGKWNSDICLCRIRWFNSRNRQTHLACFKPGQGHVNRRNLPRIWLFSVAIAGLILATPVTITHTTNGNSGGDGDASVSEREAARSYTLWIWNRNEADWKKISHDRLHSKIFDKTKSCGVAAAVLYFLEKKNAHLVECSNPDMFKAMYLIHFIDHVFTPIAEYCEEIINKYNGFRFTKWRPSLDSLFPVSNRPPPSTGEDGCFGIPEQLESI